MDNQVLVEPQFVGQYLNRRYPHTHTHKNEAQTTKHVECYRPLAIIQTVWFGFINSFIDWLADAKLMYGATTLTNSWLECKYHSTMCQFVNNNEICE